jgi:uncharacterized protein YecE (DUF72 family)
MDLFVGTSGYSYKEWKGSFYPEDLKNEDMLAYYSKKLNAVEINNTFYRLPKKEMLETWSSQVPDNFQFVLKASRKITHFKKLKEAEEETAYLFKTAATLEQKLGPVLFQLPPYLRKDSGLLEEFLAILPDGAMATFEFRHRSWFEDDIFTSLSDAGCALCVADTDNEKIPVRLVGTADWGYLRLRRPEYDEQALETWMTDIRKQDWNRAYVFFKHEDEGAGPRLAGKFTGLNA